MINVSPEVMEQLHDAKVFTIEMVVRLLHCSIRTAWRRLHELKTFTSYNHNAKYQTFPDIPRFDENGIWKYKDIGFSRHGNLTCTVRYLVDHAPEGIAGQKLCDILGVPATSLYTFFRAIPGITSHRFGRTLVFFSDRQDIKTLQMARRRESQTPLRSIDAVWVLVDRIKHPDDTVEQCVRRLRSQRVVITPQAVEMLLQRHGIEKKRRIKPDRGITSLFARSGSVTVAGGIVRKAADYTLRT